MILSSIKDLSIVVTGGASGIGSATAELLSTSGAQVTSFDIEKRTEELPWKQRVVDLRDEASVQNAIEATAEDKGKIDVLVNNAGMSFEGNIEEGTEEDWFHLWNINVMGYVRTMRSALPYLRKSQNAVIINVISCTAATGIPRRSLYSATKGAVHSLSLSAAADLIKENIRVSIVNPGTVDTPFMDDLADKSDDRERSRDYFHKRQPMGRMINPNEVASAITYLASPDAAPAVGTVLTVDGGIENLRLFS